MSTPLTPPQPTPELTPEVMNKQLDTIAKHADKNERISWNRKMSKLHDLVDAVAPFEERIMQILLEKQPLVDQINDLRAEMVRDCVHPKDMLVHHATSAECKFCNRKISLPNV